MPDVVDLPHKIKLRHYQRDVWNSFFSDEFKKYMLIWHRRAGKDDLCVNIAAGAAMMEPQYILYLLPEHKQARKVIWHGITNDGKQFLDRIPKKIIKRKSSIEMLIEFVNGSILQLSGSDNYNSLMGTNPKTIIHSEFALSNPYARQYLRPILVNNGGKELIITTPRGMNHAYAGYNTALSNPKDWYCSRLTVEDTYGFDGKAVTPLSLIESERREGAREELIQSEYYCSFEAAVLGAYYSSQLRDTYNNNRIVDNIPIDKNAKTITGWDLGFNDQTAIWIAQIKQGHFFFIKYYANYGQTFDHYADFIDKFAKDNDIEYFAHLAPHDINMTELFGTKKTRLEKAAARGINFQTVPRTRDVTEEIDEVRNWFPTFYFDRSTCGEGLACLAQYHAEYSIENNIYKSKPKHDWSSHGADALRTMIMWYAHNKMENRKMVEQVRVLYNPIG